jgi:hypothetical protein
VIRLVTELMAEAGGFARDDCRASTKSRDWRKLAALSLPKSGGQLDLGAGDLIGVAIPARRRYD